MAQLNFKFVKFNHWEGAYEYDHVLQLLPGSPEFVVMPLIPACDGRTQGQLVRR